MIIANSANNSPRLMRKLRKSLRKRYYAWSAAFRGSNYAVFKTHNGTFLLDPRIWMERLIAYEESWEPELFAHLTRVCARTRFDLFVDMGANLGFYTVWVGRNAFANEIIAFEPNHVSFAQLCANLLLNELTGNVHARQVALSDERGRVSFHSAPNSLAGSSRIGRFDQPIQAEWSEYSVECTTFDDDYAIQNKRLLFKIDVEGHEASVLIGMRRTLQTNRCYVQVEAFDAAYSAVAKLLGEFGYRHVLSDAANHFFTNCEEFETSS